MIKELIKDLVYENIDLSQGLTRAKLIAYKLNNTQFKDWLTTELNGYSDQKDDLPKYRKIPCQLFAELFVPFGGSRIKLSDMF